jgi:TolB-like protein/Tfp pilus assembly protein PilF
MAPESEPASTDAPRQPATAALPASSVERAGAFWTRAREHKLLQWTLTYAAAALAIAQAQELMSSAFGWPSAVGRVVMALLVLGLPLVVTLAWYHGHKGLKQIGAGEMMVVSVLLLVLAGGFFLVVSVPDPDLSARESAAAIPSATEAPRTDADESTAARAKPRIAIMPFDNLSPDPDNAFFTDGIHGEVLSTLANRAPGLEVISRTTMMSYRGRQVTVQEVRDTLGITHVLEGSVQREGQDVRLALQLIEARTDRNLWAHRYNRPLTNALTVQSEIAAEVASQLSVELASGGERTVLPPTTDPAAYDLYLKARLTYYSGPNQPVANLEAMLTLLDEAIARNPEFVGAYLERMIVHRLLFRGNHDASERRLELIRSDVDAAVRLAPGDPAVVWAQATWNCLQENFDLALQQFESAGVAGFGERELHATCLSVLGRYDEAKPLYERSIVLDPRNPGLLSAYTTGAVQANNPADAVRVLKLGMARIPNHAEWPFLHAFLRARLKGENDEWMRRWEQRPSASAGPLPFDDDSLLRNAVESLVYQRRYADARQLLDGAPALIRWWSGAVEHVGKTPVAHFRGWLDLLLNDETAAMQDGRALLDYVQQQKVTQWNRWYLRILDAEGRLFTGDLARARDSAREVIEITSQSRNRLRQTGAQFMAATVLAWAGEADEAAMLLERLATSSPGVPPAPIARDPTVSVPLGSNARYQALSARLEAQMAAIDLP